MICVPTPEMYLIDRSRSLETTTEDLSCVTVAAESLRKGQPFVTGHNDALNFLLVPRS